MSVSRQVKGKRPVFVSGDSDANLNRLLTIVSALAAEVAVLRDRQRTLEKLLEQHGSVTSNDIETFQPDPSDLGERMAWQQAFLRRIYAVIEREAEAEAKAGEPE